MTTDTSHRSPDAPVVEPPARRDPSPGRRVTALVAAGALAVGLLGGVGIGRVTAPAAAATDVGATGFPQGGPGGTGFPGGAPGQGGQLGQQGMPGGQQGAQQGTDPSSGSAAAQAPDDATTT